MEYLIIESRTEKAAAVLKKILDGDDGSSFLERQAFSAIFCFKVVTTRPLTLRIEKRRNMSARILKRVNLNLLTFENFKSINDNKLTEMGLSADDYNIRGE